MKIKAKWIVAILASAIALSTISCTFAAKGAKHSARVAYSNNNLREALSSYEDVVKYDPEDATA